MKTKMLLLVIFLIGILNAAEIRFIEPTLECAGVVLKITWEEEKTLGEFLYKAETDKEYKKGHPFVRYDEGHMASSLFNLKPGTPYEVKIKTGSKELVKTFTTRSEFSLPKAKRVIKVNTASQLKSAVAGALPGDEIQVAPGTYEGGLNIGKSGTAENPIVIRGMIADLELKKTNTADKKGLPVIVAGKGKEAMGIQAEDVSYVVLDHLRVTGSNAVAVHIKNSSFCVVQYCQIYDNTGDWALHTNQGGFKKGRHLLQFNHIKGKNGVPYYGIKQDNYVGPGTIIRGNYIEGTSDGIVPSGDESDCQNVKENNPDVFSKWPNHDVDVYDNTVRNMKDDDIETDGVVVNLRVFRNRFDDAQNAVSIAPVLPGPIFFIRNILTDYRESCVKYNTKAGRGTIRNIYFYHNTVVSKGIIMTIWGGTPSKNIFFNNNIFTGKGDFFNFQGLAHKPKMDNDLWYTNKTESALKLSKKIFDKGKLPWEENGLFVDPKLNSDFTLSPDSPAIDKGIIIPGVNTDFTGKAPDLGAIEVK